MIPTFTWDGQQWEPFSVSFVKIVRSKDVNGKTSDSVYKPQILKTREESSGTNAAESVEPRSFCLVVKCCLMSSDASWHIRDKSFSLPILTALVITDQSDFLTDLIITNRRNITALVDWA